MLLGAKPSVDDTGSSADAPPVWRPNARSPGAEEVPSMAVVLIARFDGDVSQLTQAYDRAHALIMSRGGTTAFGELRHHCAVSDDALFIIGVWESEEHARSRWWSPQFEATLTSVGFPAPQAAQLSLLQLHAIEPPL
jgi:hypothetical protein